MKVFVVAWSAFFPIWLSSRMAVRNVPKELIWTAQLLGAKKATITWKVRVPSARPAILSGARLSLGLAVASTVAAEMSGASAGLGYRIYMSYQMHQTSQMVAALVGLGMLGAMIDRSSSWLVGRMSPRRRMSTALE